LKKRREARRFFDIAIALTAMSILSMALVLTTAHIRYVYRDRFNETVGGQPQITTFADTSAAYTEDTVLRVEEGYAAAGNAVAYRVTVETVGYNRKVPIGRQVTVSSDATVLRGIEVLKQKESEYYGARIAGDDFKARFTDRHLPVILQGKAGKGAHIEGVSGATVTSTAVFDAINFVKDFVETHILEGVNSHV